MTKNKMTEKEIFTLVGKNAEVFGDKADMMREWAEKHIGQLERKYAAKSGKPTAKQAENLEIKEKLVATIAEIGHPVRVMDINALDVFEGYTSQKLSALLNQLADKDVGILKKFTEKRITYFTLAEGAE